MWSFQSITDNKFHNMVIMSDRDKTALVLAINCLSPAGQCKPLSKTCLYCLHWYITSIRIYSDELLTHIGSLAILSIHMHLSFALKFCTKKRIDPDYIIASPFSPWSWLASCKLAPEYAFGCLDQSVCDAVWLSLAAVIALTTVCRSSVFLPCCCFHEQWRKKQKMKKMKIKKIRYAPV